MRYTEKYINIYAKFTRNDEAVPYLESGIELAREIDEKKLLSVAKKTIETKSVD